MTSDSESFFSFFKLTLKKSLLATNLEYRIYAGIAATIITAGINIVKIISDNRNSDVTEAHVKATWIKNKMEDIPA